MCGLAGIADSRIDAAAWERRLGALQAPMEHRGPDDQGIWFDAQAGIGFAHRRLSIIDLSAEGHQPMWSASGRFGIAYNGEIYNYEQLRRELSRDPGNWRGHSDTEVLLEAIEAWGLRATLERCVGMFAFALWDRQGRRLSLVRDRLGIKPLYYGRVDGSFVFASELKSLRVLPGFDNGVDRDALALYLRYSYVPAPHTIYRGIRKLPAGCLLETSPSDARSRPPAPEPYWRLDDVVERGRQFSFEGDSEEAVDNLDEIVRQAVEDRLVADVPVGAFLSGGIDSSTVVALMQAQRSDPIRTFSIGFREEDYDEAGYARRVAQHLGTDHTELYVSPEEARGVIPLLPEIYDEPFGDSSQIPTYLVSKLARQDVKVALSGDGGDELMGGYVRYKTTRDLWCKIAPIPGVGRKLAGASLEAAPDRLLDAALGWLAPYLNRYGRPGAVSDKLNKMAELLVADGPRRLYQEVVSHWKDPASIVLGASEPSHLLAEAEDWPDLRTLTEELMYVDTLAYLPDDILVKVDRASMAVSLEARVPLLDHRVVAFCWRLPSSYKVRNGKGKWLLRRLLDRYLPTELFERKKKGFGVPIGRWLRGPLRPWAEELLSAERIRAEGYFDAGPIRKRWREHLAGEADWQYHIWDVLMFQAWLEEQGGA